MCPWMIISGSFPGIPTSLARRFTGCAQVELYERAVRKKDRWIRALAIALGAVLLGIIAVFAIDLLRHDVGWFQFSI